MVLSKEELGKLVKEARTLKSNKLRKKYTQSMLAKDIGKSQSYIGDIESGRTYPAFKVLSQIAQVCDVPFSFFENKDYFKIEETTPKSYEENLNTENNLDVKNAMDSILSQNGLMLNGEILSDDSKIALSNAIKLGLQYAEQMQKK